MSRSGYVEDVEDQWALIRYRGAVRSAIRGKRGQQIIRDLIAALDALPNKRLIKDSLIDAQGEYCALGAVAAKRGLDVTGLDPYNIEAVAGQFDIAEALAREVVYENDEAVYYYETPERRFERIRAWAVSNLLEQNGDGT